MDAFAVSICKGLAMKRCTLEKAGIVGLYFGGFQALMPLIGYFLGVQFRDVITSVDHWIAFILLGVIGGNMIREALGPEACETADASLDVRNMLALAVATSIDALAVGISFACIGMTEFSEILNSLLIIGWVSFLLTLVGLTAGIKCGKAIARKVRADLLGGIILIAIGVKVLIEHLNA